MGGFFLTFQEYTKVKYHASVETMKIELGQLWNFLFETTQN